ncbi:TSN36 protein, partial [Trogon melanurus]|nr:TSN36 protein [Trogon melanurus]
RSLALYLLLVLGFVFWVAAAAVAFGGIFGILMYKNYIYLSQEYFFHLFGWLALAVAFFLLPAGVLAISIYVKTSRYKQGLFMYLLLVLLCLEMTLGVLAQLKSNWMASDLKNTMSSFIYQYNGSPSQGPGNRIVDEVQRKLQCCGVQSYTDWLKTTPANWHLPAEKPRVPASCCTEKYSDCRGDLNNPEQLFQEGCLKKLEDQLHFVIFYTFWCCVGLSILELLAGVSNGILMRHQPFHDLQIL